METHLTTQFISYQILHLSKVSTPYFSTRQVTSKRIRRRSPQNSSLNTCVVHVAADHSFFKNVGGGSERASIEEMVYSIGMADRAFRATDFNQDGGPGDGIGFLIAAVTVFTDVTAEGS